MSASHTTPVPPLQCPQCGAAVECPRCLRRDQVVCYEALCRALDARGTLAELGLRELLEAAGVDLGRPRVYLPAVVRLLEEGRAALTWYEEALLVSRVVQPTDP